MSNIRRFVPGNLRPAPADLTPQLVSRFLAFADMHGGPTNSIPQDASIAASGRTTGDVHAPLVAAEEAGRDTTSERKPVKPEQKILNVMRGHGPDKHWTIASLAKEAGLDKAEAARTVQSMRWSGKMHFERLALASSMIWEGSTVVEAAEAAIDLDPGQFVAEAVSAGAEPIEFSDSYRECANPRKASSEHSRGAASGPMPVAPALVQEAAAPVPVATPLERRLRDDDRALKVLLDVYLHPSKPSFTSCYLRLCEWSASEGVTLPSSSTMRTRLIAAIEKLAAETPQDARLRKPGRRPKFGELGKAVAKAVQAEELLESAPLAEPRSEVQKRIQTECAREAEQAVSRRRTAGFSATRGILDARPASVVEVVATALVEDLGDALDTVKRAWPDQWWRIVSRARARGVRPGVVFGEIVEAGLNAEGGR